MHDRYVNFSSEMLRISILGITAIAGLFVFYFKGGNDHFLLNASDKVMLMISVGMFALSAGHLFFTGFMPPIACRITSIISVQVTLMRS